MSRICGTIFVGGFAYDVEVCLGGEGAAYPFAVFASGCEGYGSTPVEALHALRDEVLETPLDEREGGREITQEEGRMFRGGPPTVLLREVVADAKDRVPYTEPYTDDCLRAIQAAAVVSGDVEKADLAHAMLWAREFCDRSRDATAAMARAVREVVPWLVERIENDRSHVPESVEERTKPLLVLVAEMLDGAQPDPTLRMEGGTFTVEQSHWAIRAMVESLGKSVGPAPNFMEVEVSSRSSGRYLVTVQRPGGKSPATIIKELKEQIGKMGKDQKGKPKTKEHREKIAAAKMGVPRSEETKKKMREARLGKKHSEETKRRISESCRRVRLAQIEKENHE